MREKNLNPTAFVLHSHLYKPQQSAHADTQGRKKCFGISSAFSPLSFPYSPSGSMPARSVCRKTARRNPNTKKMLGLGAKLKDKDTVAKEREAARFHPDD